MPWIFFSGDFGREPYDLPLLAILISFFILLGMAIGILVSWRRLGKIRAVVVATVAAMVVFPVVSVFDFAFRYVYGESFNSMLPTLSELSFDFPVATACFSVLLIPAGIASSIYTKRSESEENIFNEPPPPPLF